MAKLPVYNSAGQEVGSYDVDPAEFADSINKKLLHDAVVMYRANQRQGTFGSKSRADVAGSTKKMYRQKGTGNARAGSRRSGVRRGGGHIFAKRPRSFYFRLPRKALQLATRMAIASKLQDDQVVVVDKIELAAPQTRQVASLLKAIGCEGKSVLLTTETYDVNVYKSTRNIDRASVLPAAELNAWRVLLPQRLVVTKAALDALRANAKPAAAVAG
ncbi:MAG: 50S ribosomal protein L4 [Planctomycetales bacterium]|nr:50S ribosomal protein L4 [Planctomycetales bacterium]